MMKQIYSLLLFTSSLISPLTHCMDLALAKTNEKPKNAKIAFLEETVAQISQYKQTNPSQYFADMGKVINATYAVTFLTEPLSNVKKYYNYTEQTKTHAFYNKRFVSGFTYPLLEVTASQYPTIASPIGQLIKHSPYYGGKEYKIFLTTPEERAFAKKIKSIELDSKETLINFLKKHLNSDNPKIKNLATNCTYVKSSEVAISQINFLMTINEFLNRKTVKNYFSTFNLKNVIQKELIATMLAINAFNKAEEAVPSFIEKIQPLCTSQLFNELENDSRLLNEYYRTILTDCNSAVSDYAHVTLKNKKLKIKHHDLCNELLNQHFSVAPELKPLFAFFGIEGHLPGIWAFEPPVQLFITPKPIAKKTKRHGKSYNQKQAESTHNKTVINENNTQKQTISTPQLQSQPQQKVQPIPTTNNDQKNKENIKPTIIFYDNRVLEQNKDKKDPCHGFTLITAPYIKKYGTHTTWTNKKTGHADDLVFMYGEIEYAHNKTPKTELVRFALCTGEDGATYHIEMKKTEGNDQLLYDIEFPPLGKALNSFRDSITDDFDSKVLIETDFHILVWDGGLNAAITLYK